MQQPSLCKPVVSLIDGAHCVHHPQLPTVTTGAGSIGPTLPIVDLGVISHDAATRSEVAASPPSRTLLTASENPYLFPLDLLDATSGRMGKSPAMTAARQPWQRQLSNDDQAPKWSLIHTKPRQEKVLADELRNRDIPHYLPVTKCRAVTRGRPRVTRAPQFPGYLFLWGDSDQRLSALKTNRIVATHRIDDQLQLANQLWDLADLIEKGVPLRIEERLAAGQYVRVKSGLLKGKCGIVTKRAGKTRLFVYINELLGGVSLEIEQHYLEPY
jgi:transcriptional antiterminator RfaH